jgi:hypothetical protein
MLLLYLSKYWKFGARGVSVESTTGDTHNITVVVTRHCEQKEFQISVACVQF